MNTKFIVPKVSFDPNAISRPKLLALFKKQMLNVMAARRNDTGKGKGADGQSIKPGGYSQSYIDQFNTEKGIRGGSNRTRKKGSISPVNLTITGDLLGSMQVRSTPDGAEIYFLGKHYSKLSNAQLAGILISQGFDGWFEYGQKDIQMVEKEVEKFVDDALKKLMVVK